MPDAAPVDASGDVDTITAFVEQMNGVWLVGWSGNLNHYSWVRITSATPGSWNGPAEFLSGDTLAANSPFWPCSGPGQWFIPQKPYSIFFSFPASCPGGLEAEYTFDPISAAPSYPNGAIASATVTPLSGGSPLQGWKFPGTQCDATMSSCTNPL